MNQRSVTIKDIARKLGISKSTVSRALRNHPNVKESTRKAVNDLAKEWDYRPDPVALGLLQKKTFTIGVVVPNISFPYFSHAVSGMQEIASKAGYQVMIGQSNENLETERAMIRTLASNRVDGMLISISIETNTFDHIYDLKKRNIPFVLFDRVFEEIEAPRIAMDNQDAAFRITEHLIQSGYRRIAHIAGPRSLLVSRQRLDGYKAALNKYNIPLDESLILYKGFRIDKGREAAAEILDFPQLPDAVLAVSDSAAVGAMKVFEERGLKIPDDIAMAGFNNEPFSSFISPTLTTVSMPLYEMGKLSIQMLFHRMLHPEESLSNEFKTLKTELIIRESTTRK